MGVVRIVHLSDLHFVPGKQDAQVWDMVRDFINKEVKPHAILITGDVTDSAKREEFEYAQRSLNSLACQEGGDNHKFRIVAGNHDRYLYRGNGPPLGRASLSRRHWPRAKMALFDGAFSGALQVTPKSPCDMELTAGVAGPSAVKWKIRVIGLDSSAESQWFAQGALSNSNIDIACNAAATATEQDLVIALVHHHILPIPAVEQKKIEGGGFAKLLDVTGLLNSGAVIEGFSRAQVDLVLHGHEHSPHQARFAGSDELATSVALLSAGSATGDETLKGWDLKRVHFNVIELEDDRSVWLRQVDAANGHLDFRSGRRLILDADHIRLSRFVRRNRQTATSDRHVVRKLPYCRLRKLVEFRPNRDIQLTESRTLWQVSPGWKLITSSGSGTVGKAIAQFDWHDGETKSYLEQGVETKHDQYQFTFKLPNAQKARLANRVTTRWTWAGAAVFTQAELDMLPASAKSGPRDDDEEFASILCSEEFEELVLSVRLPPQLSSPPEKIRVYYEKADAPETRVYSDELLRGLDICGPGNLDLRIAYPLPGYRYGISWPLIQGDMRNPQAARFARELHDKQSSVAAIMAQQLAVHGWTNTSRWAIYLPDELSPRRMRRLNPQTADASPQQIPLVEARGLARAAFWGDVVVARADSGVNRYEMLPDEQLLGYFALREPGEVMREALAILRIAFTSDPVGNVDERLWTDKFEAFGTLTTLLLVAAARGQ